MATKTKSTMKVVVRGGERHIYTDTNARNTETASSVSHRGLERPQAESRGQPIVFTNTQMKKVPIGSTLRHEMKAFTNHQKPSMPGKNVTSKKKSGQVKAIALPESADDVYGNPEIHSTLRVGEALIQARQLKPDLPHLVKKKLDSPNTASRFKKQTAKRVNVPESRPIFQDLVSVDVNESSLASQLRDLLHSRAEAVRPASRPRDSAPTISDIFDPEQYVKTAPVTRVRVHVPFSSVRPQCVHRHELCHLSCDFIP